jgi:hypothetical protein
MELYMLVEQRDMRTLGALAAYIVFIFVGCYVLVVMLSGFYFDVNDEVDYVSNILRWVLCTIASVGVFFCLYRNLITTSNLSYWLGSPRMLHILSAFTFILSVTTSVFSSKLQPVVLDWANRGSNYTGDTQGLLISVVSLHLLLTVLICTILVLFVVHGKHAHKINKALDERNQKQSKDLRDAIRVAPPPYFIQILADVTDKSEDFLSIMQLQYAELESIIDDVNIDKQEKITLAAEIIEKQRISIRAVLMAFARLARTYDNVNPSRLGNDIEYRANLMLTLSPESGVLEKLFPDGLPKVRFKIPTGGTPAYYLVVDRRLSVSVGKQMKELFVGKAIEGLNAPEITPHNFTPDKDVKNALLPVYWKQDDAALVNYNMIGAPEAIYHGKNVFIADTISSIEQSSHFTKDIQAAALSYFKNDKKGRSIVSLPVATRHYKNHPKETVSPDTYLGTINLYRNTPNIFSGHQANFTFFSDFTRPLSIILARKVEMHIGSLLKYYQLSNDDE